jgi:LPS sulfotransferase NodH
MSAEIVFLFAAERSGTHLLRSMLAKANGVSAPGEICNASSNEIRTAKMSYLRFREEISIIDRDFFYPTAATQTRLLDRYLSFARDSNEGKQLIVLDVKYAHVHNFNAFWWDILSRPFLIDYAIANRLKVIHLVRDKPYQTVISDLYAQQTGVWRTKDPNEVPFVDITVKIPQLKARVRRLARVIGLFDQWLSGAKSIRITYEELTGNLEPCLATLSNFLGIDKIPAEPGFLKTTPPYDKSIANYADLSHLIDVDLANCINV